MTEPAKNGETSLLLSRTRERCLRPKRLQTTPSSPVIIPMRGHREPAQTQRPEARSTRRHHGKKQSERSDRRMDHSPDVIPPSVAALLAISSIPPQKNNSVRKRNGAGSRLTVDSILEQTDISEKEFSLSLGRSPLDFLLSSPDELDEDSVGSENGRESIMSSRTMSSESMPSLDGDSFNESSISLNSLITPGSCGKRSLPTRRRQPLYSPLGETSPDDPLSSASIDLDELDLRVFDKPQDENKKPVEPEAPRRKSALKSNLTASLRAVGPAARSFSSFTAPTITPDYFLTRSIISTNPQVPFADERMPLRLEDTPTAALRRYLNPTTTAPIEAHVPSSLAQTMGATKYTASIQMQTYKVSRPRKGTSPSVISRRTQTTPEEVFADVTAGPVARQRNMRENSDFIRIAVMEMAMQKNGKLDDHKPGRAKWALPPREISTKPYEIGENGVPVRWIAITR
ncbi:hypothetical protein BKA64DRAFT_694063 [Cadophora sp. MPI-SDFR-AT-0126]|nr:hypothetical protein BKA64DRAFT_694063 [Leotiomycetes sp. MPI-SDFR-AT-0126]